MTELEQRIADLVAENAGIDRSQLQPSSTMDDFAVPSIAQLETLFAVEEAFDVYLPDDREKHFTLSELAATVQHLIDEKRR
jgi:acyl carrier protein